MSDGWSTESKAVTTMTLVFTALGISYGAYKKKQAIKALVRSVLGLSVSQPQAQAAAETFGDTIGRTAFERLIRHFRDNGQEAQAVELETFRDNNFPVGS